MKGKLVFENHEWQLECSDTHAYGQGWIPFYLKLSSDSNVIKYVNNGELRIKPLEVDLYVDYEVVTIGYDKENYAPIQEAKLIFPEYENQFEYLQIMEYLQSNKKPFDVKNVDTIRDGGTKVIETTGEDFYVEKNHQKLYSSYPLSEDNKIEDSSTIYYLCHKLERHIEKLELEIQTTKDIIKNLKH